MAGEITRGQALAMQAALAKIREEDEARKLGEFRATHGGWSPNQGGFTYGLGAEVNPAGFGPQPAAAQRPVNKPQFLVPDYTPEQMGEVVGAPPMMENLPGQLPPGSAQARGATPGPLTPAPQSMATPNPMPRPGTQQGVDQEKTRENKTANAAFRRFMTTFGGQRGGR
jgi:hypothetical protein